MVFQLRTSYGCGVELALDVIGRKWMALILVHIKQGAKHYTELRTLIPGLSEKMLTERLGDLVSAGLIERHARGRRVSYTLGERGERLPPALEALHAWGEWLAEEESIALDSAGGREPGQQP
ncbi:MAG: helix-turn-helix domain-containing protein [Myxococcota bacterium]